jgi:hypothetical protein
MINSENPTVPPGDGRQILGTSPTTWGGHDESSLALPPAVHVSPRATGAALLALIAALVVCGIWFAFYLVVFLPRASP